MRRTFHNTTVGSITKIRQPIDTTHVIDYFSEFDRFREVVQCRIADNSPSPPSSSYQLEPSVSPDSEVPYRLCQRPAFTTLPPGTCMHVLMEDPDLAERSSLPVKLFEAPRWSTRAESIKPTCQPLGTYLMLPSRKGLPSGESHSSCGRTSEQYGQKSAFGVSQAVETLQLNEVAFKAMNSKITGWSTLTGLPCSLIKPIREDVKSATLSGLPLREPIRKNRESGSCDRFRKCRFHEVTRLGRAI